VENDFIFVIFGIVAIVLIFLFLWEMPNQRDEAFEIEKDLVPIFSAKKLWGVIGSVGYHGPFIRLTLYEDFIIIGAFAHRHVLYLVDIFEVKKKWPNSIVIKHKAKSVPERLVVAYLKKEYLELLLKQVGKVKQC